MNNIPEVKIGIVAVSRDCFPESLSVNRRKTLVDALKKTPLPDDVVYEPSVGALEKLQVFGKFHVTNGF
ncbi:MAG: hypothetical protein LUE24_08695 [Lachnospiraceae bacterium]|nr:hypothetical protein [Lachnospiraceae bacterium]